MSFNLAVILTETAQSAPDKPAAVFDGGQLTYRQLNQASNQVAAALAAAGLRPGDPIALQLPNIPQFLISCGRRRGRHCLRPAAGCRGPALRDGDAAADGYGRHRLYLGDDGAA